MRRPPHALYSCKVCAKRHTSLLSFEVHVFADHPNFCMECMEQYKDKPALDRHNKTTGHNTFQSQEEAGKIINCKYNMQWQSLNQTV